MELKSFFGGAYQSEAPTLAMDECINMYCEVAESGAGKAIGRLRGTPGSRLFINVGVKPVRGLWSGEGRLFAAAGSRVWEIAEDPAHPGAALATLLGTGIIDNGTGDNVNTPVTFFPNGHEMMIISNNHVYRWDGVTLSEPTFTSATYTDLVIDAADNHFVTSANTSFDQTDPGMTLVITAGGGFTGGSYTIISVDAKGRALLYGPGGIGAGTLGATGGHATESPGALRARSAAVLDTYGIIAPAPNGTPGGLDFQSGNNIYISQPNDFSTWNTLDSGSKEGYPDHILAIFADHEELYVFGDLQSTEVWRDTGNANFPFERDMSAFMHYGLAAQYSVVRLGFAGVAWLAWSAGTGDVQAIYAQGFSPQRVSTHAIEAAWRRYPTLADAEAYSYIEDGHNFWVINFPSADATWVYDLTASQQMGKPMWHKRGEWDAESETLHRDRFSCHAFGYVDGITAGAWQNQPVHFCGDYETGNIYVRYLDTGDAAGQPVFRRRTFGHLGTENYRTFLSRFELLAEIGLEPITATLDVSRDYGNTFSNPRTRSASAPGDRLVWWRLGASRDAVFRLTTNTTAKVSFINTFGEGAAGNS